MPSKFGLHLLNGGPGSTSLISAGCRVLKYVNSIPPANLPPDALVVVRWVENPDNVNDQFGLLPEVAAGRWVDKQLQRLVNLPKSAYVEGPNENNCESQSQAEWFSRFEITRMQLMESRGYKCVIGNFGTGRPPLPSDDGGKVWTALLPMLRYAKSNGHLLGLHEYAHTLDTWNLLRYRRVYSFLPLDAQPNLVITEWGMDGAPGTFREQSWRSTVPDPDRAYFDLVRAYDNEMQKDTYALGFQLFTLGNDGNWGRFDIANQPLISLLENYLKETPPMAKFFVGQNVWTVAAANLQSGEGKKIGDVPAGVKFTVLSGPNKLPGKGEVNFYKVQSGGTVGQLNEDALTSADPSISNKNRKLRVRVTAHGTPHPVHDSPGGSIKWTGSFGGITDSLSFFLSTEYDWVGGEWWFKVEGPGLFGTGWVKYAQGGNNPTNRLEVYNNGTLGSEAMDNRDLPDFNHAPAVWPPTTSTPPVEPPPVTPPPVVTWPEPPPIPTGFLLAKYSFESGWSTDDKGNHVPSGLTLKYSRSSGEPMPFTPKHADNTFGTATVEIPATAMGWGEYVFKRDLPADEKLNGPRAIILDGDWAYKAMGNIAQYHELRWKVSGPPGKRAALVVHVSAESQDVPQSRVHPGKLEPDHMLVGVQWGNVRVARDYATMQAHRDIRKPNGDIVDRPWNRFVVIDVFPPSGELEMVLVGQNNWPRTFPVGGNDFFYDDFRVILLDEVEPPPVEPPVDPPPPTHKLFSEMTTSEKDALIELIRSKVGL